MLLCGFSLLISGLLTYQKLAYFIEKSFIPNIYLGIFILIFISFLILKRQAWYGIFMKLVLWFHILVHGLVLITLPIGLVFALIGSYWLALQVFVLVYLSSALVVLLNIHTLKKLRLGLV